MFTIDIDETVSDHETRLTVTAENIQGSPTIDDSRHDYQMGSTKSVLSIYILQVCRWQMSSSMRVMTLEEDESGKYYK